MAPFPSLKIASQEECALNDEIPRQWSIFLLLTTLDDRLTQYVLHKMGPSSSDEIADWRRVLELRKKANRTLLVRPESSLALVRLQDYLQIDFDFSSWLRFIRKSSVNIADVVVFMGILRKSEEQVSQILKRSAHQTLIALSEGLVLLGEELS
ncbi:MAG: hypothetical protein NZ480_02050 [Bdellovibrionaceae bacterium]|nr:hypothetical protein [Pseudobdellovibrionaceae bacterium]MDW8190529.1 hypothetical protein [Pseudobdellovibrionaceae bacterium]